MGSEEHGTADSVLVFDLNDWQDDLRYNFSIFPALVAAMSTCPAMAGKPKLIVGWSITRWLSFEKSSLKKKTRKNYLFRIFNSAIVFRMCDLVFKLNFRFAKFP